MPDIDQIRREEVRWRILKMLNMAKTGPELSEAMLLRLVADEDLPLTTQELRHELVYLEDRKLIHIKDRSAASWQASIGHHGVDIAEYTVPCQPGIARPPR